VGDAWLNEEHKRIEWWFLNAARSAGVPIPTGEIPGDKPDFRFHPENGALGVELSEVLRPASSNNGILPVAEEALHDDAIKTAQHAYYAIPNAKPVHVSVYFTDTRGEKPNKRKLTRAVTAFVRANADRANPYVTFIGHTAPDGFNSVVIASDPDRCEWWGGEAGGITLADILPQVQERIAAKDKLVPIYRSNLPEGAQVWLLLYTGVKVARSMPIPHGAEEWRVPFRFDRVFWFTALESQFMEIQRADSAPRCRLIRTPAVFSKGRAREHVALRKRLDLTKNGYEGPDCERYGAEINALFDSLTRKYGTSIPVDEAYRLMKQLEANVAGAERTDDHASA
jgi:hypothetical protein